MNVSMKKWMTAVMMMMAVMFGFSSCEEEQPGGIKETKFDITENEVNVVAMGGIAKVTYSIENPIEGMSVAVENDCEWISDFDTAIHDEITFSVAENKESASRNAVITVTYGDLKDQFTVKQVGTAEKAFVVEALDIKQSTFTAKVTPADKKMTYLVNYTEKAFFDTYNGDMKKFVEKDLEWYEYLGGQQGLTLEETLAKFVVKGDVERKMKGMLPEVEYVCFVYGVDVENATVISDVVYTAFTTLPVDMVDVTFDVDVEVQKGEFDIKVAPSDNGQGYFFDYYVKADLDKADATVEQAVQAYILHELDAAEANGETRQHRLQELLDFGPAEYHYEGVTGGLDCIAFAVAINEDGFLCSKASTKDFKTEEVKLSDNKITISSSEITASTIKAEFATTNEDPYVVLCSETKNWEGKSDDEILSILIDGSFSLENVYNGNSSHLFAYLTPETSYTVFAFGYDFGVTTKLFKSEFTTEKAADPADLTFTFEYSNVSSSSFDLTIIPDPQDATYIYDVVPAEFTADDVKEALGYAYDEALQSGSVKDMADFFSQMASIGTISRGISGLTPDTEYRVFAVGVYTATGEYATEIFLAEESVRTEAGAGSDGSVDVAWDKYFDAKDLSVEYPEVVKEEYRGGNYAMLPTVTTTKQGTGAMFFLFWVTSVEDDGTELSDAQIIELLSKTGSGRGNKKNNYFMEYGKSYWIYAVGQDFPTNAYTEVFKQKVTLTKEGVSPVSEYQAQ